MWLKKNLIFLGLAIAFVALFIFILPHQRLDLRNQATQPQEETIDVLSYFLGNQENLTGTHDMKQVIDLDHRISYYAKFNNPGIYEVHTWDNDFIYLREDHDQINTRTYSFDPGIWAKRYMQVGETINMSTNKISNYDPNCQATNQNSFPYQISLESHQINFDTTQINPNSNMGIQDVIVINYEYSGGGSEKFYYSQEHGWILWQLYQDADLITQANFMQIKPTVSLHPSPACLFPPFTPTLTPTSTPAACLSPFFNQRHCLSRTSSLTYGQCQTTSPNSLNYWQWSYCPPLSAN